MHYKVALGLGSNIGRRFDNLRQAVSALKDNNIIHNIRLSEVYNSVAMLPEGGPEDWNKDFLNMVVAGFTKLSPEKLLESVHAIERSLGREVSLRWSPRIIDIDIIAYENLIISEQNLNIPHKLMLTREWVMLPLSEVWPEWQYPITGDYFHLTVKEIVKKNFSKVVLEKYSENMYA